MGTTRSALMLLLLAGLSAGCQDPTSDSTRSLDRSRDAVLVTSFQCDGTATASGFQIDPHHIVTNRHVVEGTREVRVTSGQHTETALEVSTSTNTDLAVLRIAQPIAPVLQVATDPTPGDFVWVIGYPRGGPATSTSGRIVDYTTRLSDNGIDRVIRSRATVDLGNSGGPMENRAGEVVGLVFAIDLTDGFAVAIPSSRLKTALDDIRTISLTGC